MEFSDLEFTIRPVDLLDILIVSVFVYVLLSWLYHTTTRAAALGVLALGCLYLVARSMGMVLTTMAFHAGALVGLLALVVVFQEDVRRGLQRLPLHGAALLRRFSRTEQRNREEVEVLVDVAAQLAETKTGALLVLAGKEPIATHLSSGIRVSGAVNKELLLSIFHTGSPGHDGAVVVDRGMLLQFAAHLPLARRPLAPEMGGTRHRAAVGLAERCDALVIVVSEERGVISLAEAGEITEVDPEGLRNRLGRFFESRFPVATGGWLRSLTANVHLKLLSLVLAVAAWGLLVASPDRIHRTFAVPIEYRNLPEHLELGDDAPEEARVTLAGPEIAFRALEPGLLRITLDASEAHLGTNQFLLTAEELHHPPQLDVEHIQPREIEFTIQRLASPPEEDDS